MNKKKKFFSLDKISTKTEKKLTNEKISNTLPSPTEMGERE
jgi:hypothetical protein